MSSTVPRIFRRPAPVPPAVPVHRFTVEQYHQMIRSGILTENDRVELLAGWVVDKMPQHPAHAGTASIVQRELEARVPDGWIVRVQFPITLADSEPEPDLAVVRGPQERYLSAHPTVDDISLIVEVADTTLSADRERKLPIYAAAKIPAYWIVNLVEFTVEVYTDPRGGKRPTYRQVKSYGREFGAPLTVGGVACRGIPVARVFPTGG